MRSVSQSEDMDDGLDFHQTARCLGCDRVLDSREGAGDEDDDYDESGLADGGMLPCINCSLC
jgi:hypothetical protein